METDIVEKDLFEQAISMDCLNQAWYKVYSNHGSAGSDNVTVEIFEKKLVENLKSMNDSLQAGQYHPLPLLSFEIKKSNGESRVLHIPSVQDRIIQQSILYVIEPLFDPLFQKCSYAYRKGRSSQRAIHELEQNLKSGFTYFVRSDIDDFFDSIDHEILIDLLRDKIHEEKLILLLRSFIDQKVNTEIKGISQGCILSPLFSNIYLNPFDIEMINKKYRYIRYSDDLLILEASDRILEEIVRIQKDLLSAMKLRLNDDKVKLGQLEDHFTFLGFEFGEFGKRPSVSAMNSFFEKTLPISYELEKKEKFISVFERIKAICDGWKGYFALPNVSLTELINELKIKIQNDSASIPLKIVALCILVQLKDTKTALQYFVDAIALKPSEFRLLFELGIVAINLGEVSQAIELLNKANYANPDDRDCLYYLGLLEYQRRHYSKAIQYLQRAVHLDNDFKEGNQLLSHICKMLGLKGLANSYKADEIEPIKIEIYDTVADYLLNLFWGREDVFGREFTDCRNREGFLPVRRSLTREIVNDHLSNNKSVGVYLLQKDNSVSFSAIDIDAKFLQSNDRMKKDNSQKHALEVAGKLRTKSLKYDMPCYLECTGGKGYHLWFFYENPIPARNAKDMMVSLIRSISFNKDLINIEIFPVQSSVNPEALGSLIRLPLGKSSLTGENSYFMDEYNQRVDSNCLPTYLDQIQKISLESLYAAIQNMNQTSKANPESISPEIEIMIQKCSVLQSLVAQAENSHELRHVERLVILYSIGNLGEEGKASVHAIMKKCSNYSRHLTQKWLDRLKRTANPISCLKIRDWLSYISPVEGCNCKFKLKKDEYPTPSRFIWEYYQKIKNTQQDELTLDRSDNIKEITTVKADEMRIETVIEDKIIPRKDIAKLLSKYLEKKQQVIALHTELDELKSVLLSEIAENEEMITEWGKVKRIEGKIILEI